MSLRPKQNQAERRHSAGFVYWGQPGLEAQDGEGQPATKYSWQWIYKGPWEGKKFQQQILPAEAAPGQERRREAIKKGLECLLCND